MQSIQQTFGLSLTGADFGHAALNGLKGFIPAAAGLGVACSIKYVANWLFAPKEGPGAKSTKNIINITSLIAGTATTIAATIFFMPQVAFTAFTPEKTLALVVVGLAVGKLVSTIFKVSLPESFLLGMGAVLGYANSTLRACLLIVEGFNYVRNATYNLGPDKRIVLQGEVQARLV